MGYPFVSINSESYDEKSKDDSQRALSGSFSLIQEDDGKTTTVWRIPLFIKTASEDSIFTKTGKVSLFSWILLSLCLQVELTIPVFFLEWDTLKKKKQALACDTYRQVGMFTAEDHRSYI
jgi:hypothetical protein